MYNYCAEEKELKEKLKGWGMTYKELANKMGWSYSTVSQKLNGFNPLKYHERRAIECIAESYASQREKKCS